MIDLHIHTIFSDGKNTIEETVDTAVKLGLKKIAITDHVRRSSDWFLNYYKEIKSIKREQIEILVGFEAKAINLEGEIDVPPSAIELADIKLGAIHRIPQTEIEGPFFTKEEVCKNKEAAYLKWLKTTISLIKNKDVDIIAHPFFILYKYGLEHKEEDVNILMKNVIQNNKKVELTKRYSESNKPLLEFISKHPFAINYISYGSDAHSIEELAPDNEQLLSIQ